MITAKGPAPLHYIINMKKNKRGERKREAWPLAGRGRLTAKGKGKEIKREKHGR